MGCMGRAVAGAAVALTAWAAACGAQAADGSYGPELEGFDYAYPASRVEFTSQRQALHMAYLDVAPRGAPNGRTAILLHGKNFCAGTWADTIAHLSASGYRVVAPDQIGFCKSSKPQAYQFSFRQLAANTHDLLARLGIGRATLIGHSTGGMLAAHYALLFPETTEQLILVDPIGLEDWLAAGVPPVGVDRWYARELTTDAASIRAYEKATYYAGRWEPRFEPWVAMLAGLYAGPGREAVAWDSALIYDMILTQPVVHQFGRLRVPTVLMIGDKDVTAIGKDFAPAAIRSTLGDYPALGKAAAANIPGAKLVEFRDLGHAPQIQDPALFHATLDQALDGSLPDRSVR